MTTGTASTNFLYHLIDILFVVVHTSLIVFSLTGWIWKKTRILNLIILGIIGFTWLFVGLLVGTLGYCPLTDWHFTVLGKLGITGLPSSYVKYLIGRITGINISPALAEYSTLICYLIALALSTVLNIRDFRAGRHINDSDKKIIIP